MRLVGNRRGTRIRRRVFATRLVIGAHDPSVQNTRTRSGAARRSIAYSVGSDSGRRQPAGVRGKARGFLGAAYVAALRSFRDRWKWRFAWRRGPGDSVLVSPLACLATTMPILQTGGQPVWCDIDPNTGSLKADEISKSTLRP